MGKPVIVFIDERDKAQLPRGMWEEIPFVKATHETLVDTMKEILAMNRQKLAEIGRESHEFVTKWHDSKKIAETMVEVISNETAY